MKEYEEIIFQELIEWNVCKDHVDIIKRFTDYGQMFWALNGGWHSLSVDEQELLECRKLLKRIKKLYGRKKKFRDLSLENQTVIRMILI